MPIVSNKGREGYKAFLEGDVPESLRHRAGRLVDLGGRQSLGHRGRLARCRELAKTACKLYAVNDDVVWKP